MLSRSVYISNIIFRLICMYTACAQGVVECITNVLLFYYYYFYYSQREKSIIWWLNRQTNQPINTIYSVDLICHTTNQWTSQLVSNQWTDESIDQLRKTGVLLQEILTIRFSMIQFSSRLHRWAWSCVPVNRIDSSPATVIKR